MKLEDFDRQVAALRERTAVLRRKDRTRQRPCPELQGATLDDLLASVEELAVAEEELRNQNEELAATREALETQRQRYQDLFEFAPDAYLETDPNGVILEANRAASDLLRIQNRFLIGKPLAVYISRENASSCLVRLSEILEELSNHEGHLPRTWDIRLQPRDGPPVEASVTIRVVLQGEGVPAAVRWLIRDVSERKEAERQVRYLNNTLAERVRDRTHRLATAQQRSTFLAQASAALATSLDYQTTLGTVAHLALPQSADWCSVDLLDDDGGLCMVAMAHVDPAREALANDLRQRYPPLPETSDDIWSVFCTGKSVLVPEVTEARWRRCARDPEHLDLLRKMDTRSVIRAPLRTHGETFGVLSVGADGSRRRYTPDDQSFLDELAGRAALAVENARLYRRAQEANAAKDRFLAVLSHELRTPLTPIQAAAELLRRAADDPARVCHAAEVIERNVRLQASLVNDLLDLSRITQEKVLLDRRVVALRELMEDALDGTRDAIRTAGLILDWQAQPEEVYVEADPLRLQQIVLNLLSNAIKHTPEGGRITVALVRQDQKVRISVADTGIGIAPEALSRIFEMFHQEAGDGGPKGLGIGLALVEALVRRHGGRVWAESGGPGGGSRFTVELPLLRIGEPPLSLSPVEALTAAEMKRTLPDAAGSTPPTVEVASVLLVEDSPDSRETAREVLELTGYRVREAASAEEALSILEEWRPDVILSDIGLPGMDGHALMRRVRQMSHQAGVVAIAITGYGSDTDCEQALAAGFDDHMVKPLDLEALDQELRARLAQRRLQAEEPHAA